MDEEMNGWVGRKPVCTDEKKKGWMALDGWTDRVSK